MEFVRGRHSSASRINPRRDLSSRAGRFFVSNASAPGELATPRNSADHRTIRIGFIPLVDAAPLIVASALRYFEQEGLDVVLVRQAGWTAVRAELASGGIDASHAFAGMPIISQLGRDAFSDPIVTLMYLGQGGSAITVSNAVAECGVYSAPTLHAYLRQQRAGHRLVFAHTATCSSRYYLLREFLATAGIHPDRDVTLCALTPNLFPEHLAKGYIDGCIGSDPWNTLCGEHGKIIAWGTDIQANHAEHLLAASQRRLQAQPGTFAALIRAVVRACAWCSDPHNHSELAALLAAPAYLNRDREIMMRCLEMGNGFAPAASDAKASGHAAKYRSFDPEWCEPNAEIVTWILQQMTRWGQLSPAADIGELAAKCCETEFYRTAIAGVEVPDPHEPIAGKITTIRPAQLGGPPAAKYAAAGS